MNRSALENLLAKGSDNAMLRYTLGLVFFKEKDHDAALVHLEQALAQDRNHSASWKLYGKVLVAVGREAASTLRASVRSPPRRASRAPMFIAFAQSGSGLRITGS